MADVIHMRRRTIAESFTTTLSFRGAYRCGAVHLAGQAVRVERRVGSTFYRVFYRGEHIWSVYRPAVLREPGGPVRTCEASLPPSPKLYRRMFRQLAALDERARAERRTRGAS